MNDDTFLVKTCCITGHRDLPPEKIGYVEEILRQKVQYAIKNGYIRFLSGFADGTDLLFASIIADKKKEYPDIQLEAVIPYRGRLKTKNSAFQTSLKYCDQITVVNEDYKPSCYMLRNRYMVDESQMIIAVYDGRNKGGTLATLRYAYKLQRVLQVIQI